MVRSYKVITSLKHEFTEEEINNIIYEVISYYEAEKPEVVDIIDHTLTSTIRSGSDIQPNQTFMNTTTSQPSKVKQVVQTNGQNIVEVVDPVDSTKSQYIEETEFERTNQPVQGLSSSMI